MLFRSQQNPNVVKSYLQANPELAKGIIIKNLMSKGMSEEQAAGMVQQIVAAGKLNDTINSININDIIAFLQGNQTLMNTIINNIDINSVIDSMSDDYINNNIKPVVYKAVYDMALSYNNTQVPIYPFTAINGTTVKDKGYFVGGNIGAAMAKATGEPIYISNDSPMTNDIKNALIDAIKNNLGSIIQSTGIKDIINDVKDTVGNITDTVGNITDAVGDLSDSLNDLADSLNDKSDDVDDAWDKVFDRFDNEPGWGKRDGYIYYYDEDGISLKGPQTINGKTYYFNRIDGAMETGWQIVDGKKCYFDKKKGYELFSQWVQDGDDWYFLGADGAVEKSQ